MAKKSNSKKGYTDILLEEIGDQVKSVAEGVETMNQKLDRFHKEALRRFSGIEGRLSRIEAEIISIKRELQELKQTLTRKADLDRLVALERRVAALEAIIQQPQS